MCVRDLLLTHITQKGNMFVFFSKKVQSTDLFYVWWRIADSLEQNFIAWDLDLDPDFNFSRISPRLFGARSFACFIFLTDPNTRILEEIALNGKDCKFFPLKSFFFSRCLVKRQPFLIITNFSDYANNSDIAFLIYSSTPTHNLLPPDLKKFYSTHRTCYLHPANLGNNGKGFSFDPNISDPENSPFFTSWLAVASLYPIARKLEFLVRRSLYASLLLLALMFDIKRAEYNLNRLILAISEFKSRIPLSETIVVLAVLLDVENDIINQTSELTLTLRMRG